MPPPPPPRKVVLSSRIRRRRRWTDVPATEMSEFRLFSATVPSSRRSSSLTQGRITAVAMSLARRAKQSWLGLTWRRSYALSPGGSTLAVATSAAVARAVRMRTPRVPAGGGERREAFISLGNRDRCSLSRGKIWSENFRVSTQGGVS